MSAARRRRTLGVVVPTLNEAELLPRLLARLANAPDAPDELIVSDGGSTDGTPRLAAEGGARVVAGSPGRGTQQARGARALGAELFCFLHADSLPEPGALDALRGAFDGEGAERVVGAALRQRIEAKGIFYRLVERGADRRVRRGLVFGDSGLTVRREAYLACGGFADLPLFEDVDLSRRLRALGDVRLVDARLGVSARRWQREGPLRRTLRNRILRWGYALGVDPRRLARHYRQPPGPGRGPEGESGGDRDRGSDRRA